MYLHSAVSLKVGLVFTHEIDTEDMCTVLEFSPTTLYRGLKWWLHGVYQIWRLVTYYFKYLNTTQSGKWKVGFQNTYGF